MRIRKGIWIAVISLILASIACSVPVIDNLFQSESTPTITQDPTFAPPKDTPTPLAPLPPTLVEVKPVIGEELKPDGSITLYFDQPMDPTSVEAAIKMEPSLSAELSWLDDSTLQYSPSEALELATKYNMTIDDQAKSNHGLSLDTDINLAFTTPGFLEVTQVFPQSNTFDVDPASSITVVFNRPVVPLEVEGAPPHPLTITPAVSGDGEWISTSIYRFQPDPAFPGGTSIRVQIGTDLEDIGGSHLERDVQWYFFTSNPEVIQVDPLPDERDVPLNQTFRVSFNQTMDALVTQQAFSITSDDDELVPGNFVWEDDGKVLLFQPSVLLEYDQSYSLLISQEAQNPQGTAMQVEFNLSFRTVRTPAVVSTTPRQGGTKEYNKLLSITFTSPMDQASMVESVSISPDVENLGGFWRDDTKQWIIYGDFEPATSYQLRLEDSTKDIAGTRILEPYLLRFTTGDLPPHLGFLRYNEVLTLSTFRPPVVELQVRNLNRLDMSLYRLSLEQFFSLMRSDSYSYPIPTPTGELIRSWSQSVSPDNNLTEVLKVPLQPNNLPSGPYMFIVESPDDQERAQVRLLMIRDVELVIKSTVEDALIWAVDLSTGQPIPDHEINLYAHDGVELGRGQTDSEGILELAFSPLHDPYDPIYAVSGLPGESGFGFTGSTWAEGISAYNFGVWMNPLPQDAKVYIYTDRPIYRPGHTIHYRGIVRDLSDDQFQLPQDTAISVELIDLMGQTIQTQLTIISSFGTFQGNFKLNPDADLGEYQISTEYGSVFLEVAAYRKPEFTIRVMPSSEDVAQGDPLSVDIETEYFFGGPVADAEVQWQVYSVPTFPPGIPQAINWFNRASYGYPIYDIHSLVSGEGITDVEGKLSFDVPTTLEDLRTQLVFIDVTLTDSSGLPVTESSEVFIHPATIYLALDPDRYSMRENETALVRLSALDWEGNLIPGQVTQVDVERLLWKQVVNENGRISYESEATLVNHAFLTTTGDGTVLFSFEPQTSGNYRIRASSKDPAGRELQTELTIWVSGQKSRVWRQPSAERMVLIPDRDTYSPGQIANILIPSPFEGTLEALVTIERRGVISHEIISIDGDDATLSIPIQEQYIPNIFVSVVLIQPASQEKLEAIAMGLVELDISPKQRQLNIELTSSPPIAEPGETMVYDLLVRDSSGNPVQAEFSLALVDLAVLSLTEPNSPTPIEGLYAPQSLGVRTGASVSLKAEGSIPEDAPDGVGGGGGGPLTLEIRSDFPDTAYWNPSVVTDESGRAQVTLTLPDNLTTWRLDVRGVTVETDVGSTYLDLVSTKDLLIRPITPRFFTAGDGATVAAIVHNNSQNDLTVEVGLSASGAEISDPLTQRITIPSKGQERIEWAINIQDVEGVDLTFSANGGGLQDSSKPTIGTTTDGILPVLSYSAPDTAATAGELVEATTILEAINLPRSYDASRGDLQIMLDPSLGAALVSALESLEQHPHDTTEATISRFLPNLHTSLALLELGKDDPVVEDRLYSSLDSALQTLYQRQNRDGGWGWWRNSSSDIYLTTYSVYTLLQAEEAGFQIKEGVIDLAVEYLRAGIISPDLSQDPAFLDRQCFVLYVLALADEADLPTTLDMASQHEILSTWANAFIAATLAQAEPSASQYSTIVSDLESSAIQSATGTQWQEDAINYWNLESNIKTTSIVLSTLLDANPASSTLPGAVRWLLASRGQDGLWGSSHESAWAISALATWLRESSSLQSNYEYKLELNGQTLTMGSTSPNEISTSVEVSAPISDLLSGQPNQVSIQRGPGDGSLYYSAYLTVYRPVEEIRSTSRGLSVYREYFTLDGDCGDLENPCPKATSASVGEDLLVRVTLIVPSDQYHVVVEDPFPSGMEPFETHSFITDLSQISLDDSQEMEMPQVWRWWYFSHAELGDDRLRLNAEYLPAGTYQYTYQLHALLPGEYRVLPTRTWAEYFPEIYGQSAGEVFSIKP